MLLYFKRPVSLKKDRLHEMAAINQKGSYKGQKGNDQSR